MQARTVGGDKQDTINLLMSTLPVAEQLWSWARQGVNSHHMPVIMQNPEPLSRTIGETIIWTLGRPGQPRQTTWASLISEVGYGDEHLREN